MRQGDFELGIKSIPIVNNFVAFMDIKFNKILVYFDGSRVDKPKAHPPYTEVHVIKREIPYGISFCCLSHQLAILFAAYIS